MKIVILSDIHDNIWNLQKMLASLPQTDALICCGDLCSPFVVGLLAKGYAGPIHIVFGNNDGDLFRISQVAAKFDHVSLHGEFAQLKLGGRSIAVTHFPDVAGGLFMNRAYDVICYGHNHTFKMEEQESQWMLNPGPIMGYDPGTGAEVPATYIIYDTSTHLAQRCLVEGDTN